MAIITDLKVSILSSSPWSELMLFFVCFFFVIYILLIYFFDGLCVVNNNVAPFCLYLMCLCTFYSYLTIIPRAQMGYESIAHEAEGRMGY